MAVNETRSVVKNDWRDIERIFKLRSVGNNDWCDVQRIFKLTKLGYKLSENVVKFV